MSTRLLRYYEQQGLLRPARTANRYRDYGESDVDRVAKIRGLLDAGLPTRLIRDLLPCLDTPGSIRVRGMQTRTLDRLSAERDALDRRIRVLIRNRQALDAYIAAARAEAASTAAGA